jgi:hypothetical protein
LINNLFKSDEDIRIGIKPPSAGLNLSKKYHTRAKQQLLSLKKKWEDEARINELEIMDDGVNINWMFGEDPSDCLATYNNKRIKQLQSKKGDR